MYQHQIDTYQAEIDKMAPAKAVYNQYVATSREYNSLAALDSYSVTAEQKLPNIITELEQKLPTGATVQSLSISTTGMTLAFTVPDKDTAALTIQNLRTMTNVDVGTVTSLTGGTSEEGATSYSFSVNMVYKTETADTASGSADATAGADASTDTTSSGAASTDTNASGFASTDTQTTEGQN